MIQESLRALIQNCWGGVGGGVGRGGDGYGKAARIHSNMIITELIDIDVCVCSNVVNSPALPANGPHG